MLKQKRQYSKEFKLEAIPLYKTENKWQTRHRASGHLGEWETELGQDRDIAAAANH